MTNKRSINIFLLTMINLATVLSIRNWPITAEYGLASITLLCLAMIGFLIPSALVAAELATGWPEKGGVFVWVKEAMGERMGFFAIWLQWIENVIYYPLTLSFIAATLAYSFDPALASNKWYQFLMIIAIFWAVTYANLGGIKLSGWISSLGVIFGTLIPGVIIVMLGFFWLFHGHPAQIDFSLKSAVPHFNHLSDLAFFAGILLSFCGMEMPAVHAKNVDKPQINYPKAILISGAIIIVLSLLGTLSIAMVIPKNQINLVSGSIAAIAFFLESFHLDWCIPLIACLVAFGALGTVSTWTAGPCRGLLAAAEEGDLPKIMKRVNRHDMPSFLMIMQALIVMLLAFVFIFMPSVSSSFWILTVLASVLYLIMYILMFATGIILRYTRKDVPRHYKIPGKANSGMWIIAGIGILASSFAIVIGFFPPSQIPTGDIFFYEAFLIIGTIVFCGLPFLIYEIEHRNKKIRAKQSKLS